MNIIFALITLVTAVNIGSYFVMAAKTPIYTVFLGTVHYPLDYLDYLSYITQGKWHWLRSYHLFSGETTHLEFLNWPFVLAGHIGSWFGLAPGVTYIIMVAAGTILYLLVAYKLITLLIPTSAPKRLLLFILFLLSNEFPNIYQANGHWVFAYFYPFENWGEPLIRLTNVPHQILIQAAIMGSFVLSAMFWQQKLSLKRMAALTFVTGLVLASLQPLQWAFATGVVGVVSLFQWWKTKKIDVMFPSVILGLGGLVPALYLKHLFTYPPYSYTIAWEAAQQTYITFRHFVELNGPLMILAIVGLPFIITTIPATGAALILYTIIAIAIFFSNIPVTLHMMNNRFFSVIPTMAFAYISTEFLYKIAKKVDPARPMAFAWFAALVAIAITIPVTVKQANDRTIVANPDNVMAYLPLGAYQAFEVASEKVGPTDTVLVEPLFAQPFTAVAGKHVFVSNELATIDYSRKIAEATDFYYKIQPPGTKVTWLRKNHIAYIYTFAWLPINLPNLTIIYQNQYSILYKVK